MTRHLILAALILLLCASFCSAGIIYVKWDSPGPTFDGASWDTAYHGVQRAIEFSSPGDEIWVARGTYVGMISLRNGISLYGGFSGSETSRDQRNWSSNVAILDGNQTGTVVTCGNYVTGSVRVDGFTIRNGKASYGGGIHDMSTCSLTIANNRITGNSATSSGGGICCRTGGSPTLTNNIVIGNGAYTGGGIFCESRATGIAVTNNTIVGNSAYGVGGLYMYQSTAQVSNNIVAFNSSGVYQANGSPGLHNNCVYGNIGYDYSGLSAGTGDISVDPLLADSKYGNVHLQPGSPCRNAGLNTAALPSMDTDCQPRIQDGAVDIGADESDGTAWPSGPYAIVRVSPTGADSNDGSSWASAKRTVQAAIDASWQLGGDVWVKSGVYNEHILLRPCCYLYGGFTGTEVSRLERDSDANRTILDGGATGSVVTVSSGQSVSGIDGFTVRNGSDDKGGGICCETSSPAIVNNRVIENSATYGGGISCHYSSPLITNNRITDNNATNWGGGIYCYASAPLVTSNVFTGNSATDGGAVGCYYQSSSVIANNRIVANSATTGGGLNLGNCSANVINNTIVGNSGSSGGGIHCDYSLTTVQNNIVAFNSSGIHSPYAVPIVYRNNCVYGNTSYNYYGLPAGSGDISVDPMLAGSRYGDLHIQPGSPCRNAGAGDAVGLPATDMDGQARVQDGAVDIGADESDGTTWSPGPYITVRVSPTGDDANDGSSWALARRTVQAAIDASWELGGDVLVQAGTYNEHIVLRPGSYVYGGFAGTENSRSGKVWNAGRTILDGGGSGVVVSALSGQALSGIDGFTIADGACGILCDSSPIITNNVITGMISDGVRCESAASPLITGNTIMRNTGRGISCYDLSAPTLSNNIVALGSVGIYKDVEATGLPVVRNNDVWGNSTANYSGMTDYTGSGGNISADPLFADTSGHLASLSPCLNVGWNDAPWLPGIDIDGDPRVLEGVVDIGADEFAPAPAAGGILKESIDGTRVQVCGLAVTAAYPQFFYVEAADRSFGIRVDKVGHTFTVGMKVDVMGFARTSTNGERYIEAYYAVQSAPPDNTGSVMPLVVPNRSVGGGDLNYDPSTGTGQVGVKGCDSLNNIGLLITTTGKVTYSPTGSYFVIHDGSKVLDPSGYKGVRVVVSTGITKPAVGACIRVTGVSSIFKSGKEYYPLIRIRGQSDITTY